MQLSAVKMIQGRCTKVALGAVGVLLLAAVPALALTALGPDFFPTGQAADDGVAGVSNGPLTFDAPAVTLRKVRPQEAGDVRPNRADEYAVVLPEWSFTKGAFPNATGFDVLSANIFVSFQKDPLFWLYVATLVPGLYGDVQNYLNSLTPTEKFAILFYAFFLLSNNPHGTPSPTSPSK